VQSGYENNNRSANDFVADIIDEAVYSEEVDLHSTWIGEHHFIVMVERLRNVRPKNLTENSVLLGSPAWITDTLKRSRRPGSTRSSFISMSA